MLYLLSVQAGKSFSGCAKKNNAGLSWATMHRQDCCMAYHDTCNLKDNRCDTVMIVTVISTI